MESLLVAAGLGAIGGAAMHGLIGQRDVIGPAEFGHPTAKTLTLAIWHFSTLVWGLAGLGIAASPWLLEAQTRAWAVPAMCLPLAYGAAGNFIITRGRHFGWMVFAAIIVAAVLGARL